MNRHCRLGIMSLLRHSILRQSILRHLLLRQSLLRLLILLRLQDKNHAPFKLNGQSRTAFGLLIAPELQRLSVTVEVLRVGVMIVGVLSVGVMTVGVLSNLISYVLLCFLIPFSEIVSVVSYQKEIFQYFVKSK
jgi:hypothetical protein